MANERFIVLDDEKKIVVNETVLSELAEAELTKIKFYSSIGYAVELFKPVEKKSRNDFKIENAIKYIKAHDEKNVLDEFLGLAKKADEMQKKAKDTKEKIGKLEEALNYKDKTDEEINKIEKEIESLKAKYAEEHKAQLIAHAEAFRAQRDLFKEKYGIKEYDKVRKMK